MKIKGKVPKGDILEVLKAVSLLEEQAEHLPQTDLIVQVVQLAQKGMMRKKPLRKRKEQEEAVVHQGQLAQTLLQDQPEVQQDQLV